MDPKALLNFFKKMYFVSRDLLSVIVGGRAPEFSRSYTADFIPQRMGAPLDEGQCPLGRQKLLGSWKRTRRPWGLSHTHPETGRREKGKHAGSRMPKTNSPELLIPQPEPPPDSPFVFILVLAQNETRGCHQKFNA